MNISYIYVHKLAAPLFWRIKIKHFRFVPRKYGWSVRFNAIFKVTATNPVVNYVYRSILSSIMQYAKRIIIFIQNTHTIVLLNLFALKKFIIFGRSICSIPCKC